MRGLGSTLWGTDLALLQQSRWPGQTKLLPVWLRMWHCLMEPVFLNDSHMSIPSNTWKHNNCTYCLKCKMSGSVQTPTVLRMNWYTYVHLPCLWHHDKCNQSFAANSLPSHLASVWCQTHVPVDTHRKCCALQGNLGSRHSDVSYLTCKLFNNSPQRIACVQSCSATNRLQTCNYSHTYWTQDSQWCTLPLSACVCKAGKKTDKVGTRPKS